MLLSFQSKKWIDNGKLYIRTASGDQELYCKKCKSYFTSSSNLDYHRSRFDAETMRLTTLWYFRFNLRLRNLAEIMLSHGIDVSHQTIARWVKTIGSELGKQARDHWNPRRTVSWYVDETYIKVKGQWKDVTLPTILKFNTGTLIDGPELFLGIEV